MHLSAPQPAPLGDDAFSSGLDAVPVLDSAGAITLMDESVDLYIDIAQAYAQELSSLSAPLEAALLQSDLTGAARTLHTFKGLSLTVGAHRLSEVCRRCELALKNLPSESGMLDPVLRATMTMALSENAKQTREALDTYLSQQIQPSTPQLPPSLPGQRLRAFMDDLQDLRQLLGRSDLAALDRFAQMQARYPEMAEPIQLLGPSLKAFEFAQAMVQCNELIRKFGPLA